MSGNGGAVWSTLPELVLRCAEFRADVPLLAPGGGAAWDGAALLHRTRCGADLLARHGVGHGGHVAVDTRGRAWHEVAAAYTAISWLGAAAVMVTSAETERVTAAQIDVGASVGDVDGAIRWDALLGHGTPITTGPAAAPEDRLDVVFTSGTTGTPRAVVSRHSHWTSTSRPEMLASRGRRSVLHTGVPIGVSGGLHGIFVNHLARGVTSRWAPTAEDLVRLAAADPAPELHLTPFAARTVAGMVRPGTAWADTVRVVRLVGAPLPEVLRAALKACFPRAQLASIYALTEGGPASVVNVRGGGIGAPVGGTEVEVVDADGKPLPIGVTGEIAMRTQAQPLSYLDDERMDRDWFVGGWTRTGDIGVRGPDGTIQLIGRAREQIILGSGRLAPEAVEGILARRLPAGTEFVVAGVSSAGRSDAIAVFLVGRDGEPVTEKIREILAGMKGPFRPSAVHCVDEIPRNALGKPVRRELLARLSAS